MLKKDLGSKVFTYLGDVLVLEEFEIRPPDILSPDLENFLEQNKLASGVSDVFERLLDLPKYYQQACRVVEYNEESDGSHMSRIRIITSCSILCANAETNWILTVTIGSLIPTWAKIYTIAWPVTAALRKPLKPCTCTRTPSPTESTR